MFLKYVLKQNMCKFILCSKNYLDVLLCFSLLELLIWLLSSSAQLLKYTRRITINIIVLKYVVY